MNLEFIDKEGTKMQATVFRDHVNLYKDSLVVGKCYEVQQGIIKGSNTKFTKD